jgi:hypothetical protein
MAKATKPVAAKATKPAAKKSTPKKPTTAKKLSTRAINPQMKAGFKRNDNGNRPIFLYVTGTGITKQSAVTIHSVFFAPTAGASQQYTVVGRPDVQDGFIVLRVKGPGNVKQLPTVAPTTGQFAVLVTVDGGQQEKACLDAILYDA